VLLALYVEINVKIITFLCANKVDKMSIRLNNASRKNVARLAILSIGINYKNQASELHGCINDSNNVLTFLRARCGANIQAVVQMTDNTALAPTRQNIENAFKDLVAKQNQYTHMIVHYSGHGTQIRDINQDEPDGLDECIVPLDYTTAGVVTDDWLLSMFVNKLNSKMRVFILMDACHSSSMMDLKYSWNLTKAGNALYPVAARSLCKTNANVIMLSGCLDNNVSYDVYDNIYGASGALTSAFLQTLSKNPTIPWGTLLWRLRSLLSKYRQFPQLSSTINKAPAFFTDLL